ncbi:MAG: APC family permease [Myxococcales bacterium]|nr:MAG: APC family permease [Myxococcales bacterium]
MVFATAALFTFSPQRFSGMGHFETSHLGKAVLVVFWAFLGFESVVVPAGEMKQPKKRMAPALGTIIIGTTVIYLWVTTMVFGNLDHVAGRQNPVLDASRVVFGEAGAQLISIGILISIFGMASAHALVIPRCLYAMAQHDEMPRIVGYVHPIYRTPAIAIVLSGLITLLFAFTGSFEGLAVLSVLARLTQYLTTAISVILMRKQRLQNDDSKAKAIAQFVLPSLALLCSLCLVAQAEWSEWGKVALAAGLGIPFFLTMRRHKRAKATLSDIR